MLHSICKDRGKLRIAYMQSEMWKWGQVRPGDKVKFCLTTVDFAMAKRHLERDRIAAVYQAATSGEEQAAESLPVRLTSWHLAVWHAAPMQLCYCMPMLLCQHYNNGR